MKIPNISNIPVNLLSGLANNSDSILPMAVKDTISNCAIVATYKSKGGKDDAKERAIEEFGTGAVWLLGIPLIKALFDKTVYPLLKLNPDFDLRILKNNLEFSSVIKNVDNSLKNNPNNSLIKNMSETLNGLDLKNEVLKKFTNKDLYKGLFVGKFALSTALSAFALTKIIHLKQKSTQKRIEKEARDLRNDNLIRNSFDKKVKSSNVYSIFKGSQNKNSPSFKGAMDLFMYNPIANTSLLDAVITTTRLKEARHGERKEVALKELFQIFFIYAIAKPTQKMFEWIGSKVNLPINLDPKVLFSKNVKENVKNASKIIMSEGLNNLDKNELKEKIYSIASKDIKNPLIQLLEQNGVISVVKNDSEEALNYLKHISSKNLKHAIDDILLLNKHIDKNLTGIKAYKVFSVLGNVAIGALAMGVLQPIVNIEMRKLLNNGDNRNPAIVAQEEKIRAMAKLQ